MKFLFENSFDTASQPSAKGGPAKTAKSRICTAADVLWGG